MGRSLAARIIVPALLLSAAGAHAQTQVRCDEAPATALGTAIAEANPGAILAITGICEQAVTIASVLDAGIAITNDTGVIGAALVATDGIAGELVVNGPIAVTITGITLEGPSSDLGYPAVLGVANGDVVIENAQIVNGWRYGMAVSHNAVARLLNATVSGNGQSNIPGQCDGIRALGGARLYLGRYTPSNTIDTANAVTVENNACNGVTLVTASSLSLVGGTIEGNGGIQIFVTGTSDAGMSGATIVQQQASNLSEAAAVYAYQASRVLVGPGTTIAAGTYGSAVVVASASSLALSDASVGNANAGYPTVWASGVSHVALSSGNRIANNAGGGTAIALDHGSSLVQGMGADLGPSITGEPLSIVPAGDIITGNGTVETQSDIEIGTGAAFPSSWTGSIAVSQNSAFRMDGGISISGAVTLEQGSNGFFNNSAGGLNIVAGGITCPWSTSPSAHVSAPAKVLLSAAGPQAVTIGAVSPDCLGF